MSIKTHLARCCSTPGVMLVIACALARQCPAQEMRSIEVNANVQTSRFPHFWEQMYGSGRAVLSLRESYRDDLREVKDATGFQYIRFHGIFLDEVGLYDEDKDGNPVYNFSYVDQIYDGVLKNHVRPFVELSFMAQQLTSV